MADIRSYIKEKEKRERKQEDYKKKIARYKLTILYRVLLVIAALTALVVIMVVQYKQHIYTEYETISSVERQIAGGAKDVRLGNSVLTYSKDGAHCTDAKGNVVWNQTFQMQDARLVVNGNTVAIGDYNGRSIYVADSEKILGEITTTMPIRAIAVSDNGYVTAVLADTDVTWINTYTAAGDMIYEGQTRMSNSGYPLAVSMSPNGEILCVAYVYVDAGVLKSTVAFYNFGPVGANASDYFVSSWIYTDSLIPYVRFLNDRTSFAAGDNMLTVFTGNQKPSPQAGDLYNREVQSVFYNDRYIGLVYVADNNENRYQLVVYDTEKSIGEASALNKKTFYFDMEYNDIFFQDDIFVIYNETECQIFTMGGIEKYHGTFSKAVRLMIPIGNSYRYQLVTDSSIDTIQLK